MKLTTAIAFVALISACAPPALSRWGPSGCTAAGPVWSPLTIAAQSVIGQTAATPPKFEWKRANDTQHFLYRDNVLVGGWDHDAHHYMPWDGKRWGEECKPPLDAPSNLVGKTDDLPAWRLFGVDRTKLCPPHEECFTVNGYPADPKKFYALADGTLADDSSKGWFVVIARDAEKRAKLLADFATLPKDFTDRYHVWAAPPDHFSMQDRFNAKPRYYAAGDPTFVLQDKDGVVLYRFPHVAEQVYRGPEDLQGLLKADPNYKPDLDPGPKPPAPKPSPKKPDAPDAPRVEIPPSALVIGGLVAAIAGMGYAGTRKKP